MPAQSSAKKVRTHREKLRRQGLRPIQIWVPDMRDPKFLKDLRREALSIAKSEHEKDDQAFIDSLYDPSLFEEP